MNEVKTELGTLFVTCRNGKDYPGIMIELDRNGTHYSFAWVEVDQDRTYEDNEPTLKIHAFGMEDDPVFNLSLTETQLKELYKEEE